MAKRLIKAEFIDRRGEGTNNRIKGEKLKVLVSIL